MYRFMILNLILDIMADFYKFANKYLGNYERYIFLIKVSLMSDTRALFLKLNLRSTSLFELVSNLKRGHSEVRG